MPRAQRDLASLYHRIGATSSEAARTWYLGLKETIRSLCRTSKRCAATPEDKTLRHLLYGRKPNIYRVICQIQETPKQVHVLHIRHGAMDEFTPKDLARRE
jgi:toxin ParE1/3/4